MYCYRGYRFRSYVLFSFCQSISFIPIPSLCSIRQCFNFNSPTLTLQTKTHLPFVFFFERRSPSLIQKLHSLFRDSHHLLLLNPQPRLVIKVPPRGHKNTSSLPIHPHSHTFPKKFRKNLSPPLSAKNLKISPQIRESGRGPFQIAICQKL